MKRLINIFSLFLVGYVVFFLYTNPEELYILQDLNISIITFIMLIKLATLIVNSLFNKELLRGFDLKITIFESIYLSSITFIGNLYLPFRSGGNFRMIYLNRKYKFKSPELVSIYIYFFVVTIFLNSTIGLAALFTLKPKDGFDYYISLVTFLIFLNLSYLMLFRKFKNYESFQSVALFHWYKNIKMNWMRITRNSNLQIKLISFTFINYLLFGIEALIIFSVLLNSIDLVSVFYYNSVSVLSSLASITPASLGIKDGIIIFSSNILNLNISDIISLMIFERAFSILFSFIPGFVLLINKKITS